MSDTETWHDQCEWRYELSRMDAQLVIAELSKRLPVVTYDDGPATTLVVTIYFDTESGYYLSRATSGNGSSVKVRAREYFAISDDDERTILSKLSECYLERKERTGSIRNKERVKISKAQLGPIIKHNIALPSRCDFLRSEIDHLDLQPVLVSMYERRVWGHEELRVTLDERIRYYRPTNKIYGDVLDTGSSNLLRTPDALGPKRVLEVKHSAQIPTEAWLETLLQELPEALGFSKFIDGMASLKDRNRSKSLTRPVFSIS